jgi:hypothetical protein
MSFQPVSNFSGSSMPIVTLRDGSLVTQPVFTKTMENIQDVRNRSLASLLNLFYICENPSYIHPERETLLINCDLIDKHGRVSDIVKRIVLNTLDPSEIRLASVTL